MNMKYIAAGIGVAAIISAPIVSAAPGSHGNGNGNKPGNPPGQSISQIAKNGGGPVAILSALAAAHPNNRGLQNALKRVTANHPTTTTQTTPPTTTTTQTTPPTTTTQTTPPTTTTETTPPTTASTDVPPVTP